MSNRLSGLSSLAYQGTNAPNPPNITYATQSPTQYDTQFSVGDLWINTSDKTAWILVSRRGTGTSGGPVAVWSELGVDASQLEALTGNTGGPVGPSLSNNINVVGDGTTVTISGNPATNTLTASLVPGSFISTLEGNSGGIVSPDVSGNFNVVGDGTTISIVGNPGTNTLTASVISSVNLTLTGNTGGAVSPSANNINVVGDGVTIAVTGNPGAHTLTVALEPGAVISSVEGDSGGEVFPDNSGNINIIGTPNIITVTGNPATHTLTIDAGSEVATQYVADTGIAVPSSGILEIAGGTNINTVAAGSVVTINLDTTLTGITDLTVDNLTVTNTTTLSSLTQGVVQSNGSGVLSSSKGTNGQVLIGSTAGAPAWANLTAGANVTITNAANSITITAAGAGAGSGIIFLESQDVSGLSTLYFNSISSTYTSYLMVADKIVVPAGAAQTIIFSRLSADGGSTFINSYGSGLIYNAYNSAVFNNVTLSTGVSPFFGALCHAYVFASASPQYISFYAYFYDLPNNHFVKSSNGQFSNYNSPSLYMGQSGGSFTDGAPATPSVIINNITVSTLTAVTFTSGTIELYGLVK